MFILDSDVFLAAKNVHYPQDTMPGYWEWIVRSWHAGLVASIVPVMKEIVVDGELSGWVKQNAGLFTHIDAATLQAQRGVSKWAMTRVHEGVKSDKVDEFLDGADSLLVAFCLAHGHQLVTYEQSAPEAKNGIKLPDACANFGVEYKRPHQVFRDSLAMLVLSPQLRDKEKRESSDQSDNDKDLE
ncbi:MAG: DUF4411 family protein [Propionibacteriaceae bacterium]|nr:DUF4411 family protein [Propionibacteriaceae bacterium]